MANIEVHPPIFPIMQVKQSGSYITHEAWFYYKIRRVSDNAIVYSCLAKSQQFGANNHPPSSYIQLAPGTYEWEVHNLSKTRVILQPYIMRSDSNNQGDGVLYPNGSNNPKNAVCYGQVHGGKRAMLYFEIKEYAPGGTQWYHVNCSFWFINTAGDSYTLDAPNNTAGYYTTDISTVTTTDEGKNLSWNNPEVFGPVALIPNTDKINTSLGEITNPFYISIPGGDGGGGGDGGVVTLPPGKMITLDMFNLFNKFYNGDTSSLFTRNPFSIYVISGSSGWLMDTYGEFEAGKKAWYRVGNVAQGFVGIPEDTKYANAVDSQLVVRHGDTTSIRIWATLGNLPNVDFANSQYGIFIQKHTTGDIKVRLERDSGAKILLNETITDSNAHWYAIDFGANVIGSDFRTSLTISKGNLAFNAANLVSVGFTCTVNYTENASLAYIDTNYRVFDVGAVEFADCTNMNDFLLGVCYYPVPDFIPGGTSDDVTWLGKLNEVSTIEVDVDSFYVMVKKISTGEIIATLKFPEETI